jgi:hypothetical protein
MRKWLVIGAFLGLLVPEGSTIVTPGGVITVQPLQRSGYATTPFTLSGQTVCSRIADASPGYVPMFPERWRDGAEFGLPGYRCIRLQ